MTNYRYKWVSTVLCGEPDTAAVEKALKAGWEPVEVIPPEIEPLPGMTMEQMLRGMALYRKPEAVVAQIEAERNALNWREADPATQVDRANANIAGYVKELNEEHDRTDAGKGWSPIQGTGTTMTLAKQSWSYGTRFWRA